MPDKPLKEAILDLLGHTEHVWDECRRAYMCPICTVELPRGAKVLCLSDHQPYCELVAVVERVKKEMPDA